MIQQSKSFSNVLAGVIAATPVDTALGETFLTQQGWDVIGCAMSRSPEAQNQLQHSHPNVLQEMSLQEMLRLQQQGVQFILIFCSSLSSVLDLTALQEKIHVPIYTPLDYYQQIANSYQRFSALAANAIGLNGFESNIIQHNKNAQIMGMHNIELVLQIEQNISPEKIIADNALLDFIHLSEASKSECIVLACTHFPYLKNSLSKLTKLPVLDISTGLTSILAKEFILTAQSRS